MTFRRIGTALAVAVTALALRPARAQRVAVELPLGVGLRTPAYDRVDGLSLPFGPRIVFGDERVVIDPVATYRSHLGKVDGEIAVNAQLLADSSLSASLIASRGTFTNDAWIRNPIVNSLVAFTNGADARNYFRGDRAEGRIGARLPGPLDSAHVFVGGRFERDWSTGWRAGERQGPYSVVDRSNAADGIQRPNPLITPGHVASLIGGGQLSYVAEHASVSLDALIESATSRSVTGAFTQGTVDARGRVNTFLGQSVQLVAHLVTTSTRATNAFRLGQRYAYLGGAGSLTGVPMLALGGDHLYFMDAAYSVPLPWVTIPLVGQPYIAPHFATGAASVGAFGRPVQNLGLRAGVSLVAVDFVVNPRSHKTDFGIGLSLPY